MLQQGKYLYFKERTFYKCSLPSITEFCKQLVSKQVRVENAALEMTRLVVSVTCLMSWSTSAEIPELCTTRLTMRQKSCCQAEQAVFSWSVVFSIVVVRTMLILIHVIGFMDSNMLREGRCLNGVVLTAPELSQLLFLSVKSRSCSVPPGLLNRVFGRKS